MSLWFYIPITHGRWVLLPHDGTSAATLWRKCFAKIVSALGQGGWHRLLLLLPINHKSLVLVICRGSGRTDLSELRLRGLRCSQFLSFVFSCAVVVLGVSFCGSEVLCAIEILLWAHHDSRWLLGDNGWVDFVGRVLNNIIEFLLWYPEFSQCCRLYEQLRVL